MAEPLALAPGTVNQTNRFSATPKCSNSGLALQLRILLGSEWMGNHDSEIMDGRLD